MSTVRLLRSGQLTLPAGIRRSLSLEKGAFLEAGVENNRIVLVPKRLVEKDEAKEKIFAIVEKVWKRNKNVSGAKIESEVKEAIKNIRGQKGKSFHD